MSAFAKMLADRVERLHRASSLARLCVQEAGRDIAGFRRDMWSPSSLDGPLTQDMALDFVLSLERRSQRPRHSSWRAPPLLRVSRHLRCDGPKRLIRRALPRSRAIPPPRILSDEELGIAHRRHAAAFRRRYPQRGRMLTTLVGLLASTGLRSGEALRLDRADVDLVGGVLHIRKTKFRKDRLVPVHTTTLAALRQLRARIAMRHFRRRRIPHFFSARAAIGCRRPGSMLRSARPASSPVSTMASL